jgi:hypothetical protein
LSALATIGAINEGDQLQISLQSSQTLGQNVDAAGGSASAYAQSIAANLVATGIPTSASGNEIGGIYYILLTLTSPSAFPSDSTLLEDAQDAFYQAGVDWGISEEFPVLASVTGYTPVGGVSASTVLPLTAGSGSSFTPGSASTGTQSMLAGLGQNFQQVFGQMQSIGITLAAIALIVVAVLIYLHYERKGA